MVHILSKRDKPSRILAITPYTSIMVSWAEAHSTASIKEQIYFPSTPLGFHKIH